jgi:mRNA interferase RelE/StbE
MTWHIEYLKSAQEDLEFLDHGQRIQVLKAIEKVSKNPLPQAEGGYGKPLGNRESSKLSGYFKIKFLKLGIRVVYGIIREKEIMKIIIISIRDDNTVYKMAEKRIK